MYSCFLTGKSRVLFYRYINIFELYLSRSILHPAVWCSLHHFFGININPYSCIFYYFNLNDLLHNLSSSILCKLNYKRSNNRCCFFQSNHSAHTNMMYELTVGSVKHLLFNPLICKASCTHTKKHTLCRL